jgi:recombination protein RecT
MTPQFALALPPHIPPERFTRVAITAIQNNPDLLNADRRSLYGACMRAAQDGLLPDGKEAALVTFGKLATYMPMIGGILKKVRNSGELISITAHVVYTADEFDYWVDEDGEHMKFRPSFVANRGAVRLTFAHAKTKDGGVYIEVATEDQIKAIRDVSRSKNNGPWAGPFADEMRRKSALRRLSKRLPMSTDLDDMLHRDDDLFQPPEPGQQETAQPTQNGNGHAPEPTPKRRGASRLQSVADQAPSPQHDADGVIDMEANLPPPADYDGQEPDSPI